MLWSDSCAQNRAEQERIESMFLLLVDSAEEFSRSMNRLGSTFGTSAETMAKIRAEYKPPESTFELSDSFEE